MLAACDSEKTSADETKEKPSANETDTNTVKALAKDLQKINADLQVAAKLQQRITIKMKLKKLEKN